MLINLLLNHTKRHWSPVNLENIELEAAEAQTQYEVITANWDAAMKLKDPLEIDAAIEEQRQRCDTLLEQKNKLISDLKENLDQMDENYYIDLEKQVYSYKFIY